MIILALDQSSTKTGVALGLGDRDPRSFKLGSIVTPKRDHFGERLAHLHRELAKLIEAHEPELICYEQPFFPVDRSKFQKPGAFQGDMMPAEAHAPAGGGATFSIDVAKKLQQVAGCVMTIAALYGIPTEEYAPASWRKSALGYGRAKKTVGLDGEVTKVDFKALMKARARQLGYTPKDDNEADALGILIHAYYGPEAALRNQSNLLDMVAGNI